MVIVELSCVVFRNRSQLWSPFVLLKEKHRLAGFHTFCDRRGGSLCRRFPNRLNLPAEIRVRPLKKQVRVPESTLRLLHLAKSDIKVCAARQRANLLRRQNKRGREGENQPSSNRQRTVCFVIVEFDLQNISRKAAGKWLLEKLC